MIAANLNTIEPRHVLMPGPAPKTRARLKAPASRSSRSTRRVLQYAVPCAARRRTVVRDPGRRSSPAGPPSPTVGAVRLPIPLPGGRGARAPEARGRASLGSCDEEGVDADSEGSPASSESGEHHLERVDNGLRELIAGVVVEHEGRNVVQLRHGRRADDHGPLRFGAERHSGLRAPPPHRRSIRAGHYRRARGDARELGANRARPRNRRPSLPGAQPQRIAHFERALDTSSVGKGYGRRRPTRSPTPIWSRSRR